MLRVSVAVAGPGSQQVVELSLPQGSTAADALRAAALTGRLPPFEATRAGLGIWSHPCAPDTQLRDGDRVEVYRPLVADAKAQRRDRARLKPSTRSRSGS